PEEVGAIGGIQGEDAVRSVERYRVGGPDDAVGRAVVLVPPADEVVGGIRAAVDLDARAVIPQVLCAIDAGADAVALDCRPFGGDDPDAGAVSADDVPGAVRRSADEMVLAGPKQDAGTAAGSAEFGGAGGVGTDVVAL